MNKDRFLKLTELPDNGCDFFTKSIYLSGSQLIAMFIRNNLLQTKEKHTVSGDFLS
ncbi:hypothetical protein GCM10011325_03380 [Dyadobacter sediminis]|nr:hypothetical protein GCM10011325_03380 [Dyadobacter sediminis]